MFDLVHASSPRRRTPLPALSLPAWIALTGAPLLAQGGAVALLEDPSEFSGGETVLDFEGFAAGTQLAAQYAGLGATFALEGGGLPWISADGGGGNHALQNFDPAAPTTFGDVVVTFDGPQNRLGFRVKNNADDDLLLSVYCLCEGSLMGTHFFETSFGYTFVGLESEEPFNQILIDVSGASNGGFRMDDLRFEYDPGAVIVDAVAPQVTITYPPDGTIFKTLDAFIEADVLDSSPTTVTTAPAGLEEQLLGGGGSISGWIPLVEGENTLTVSAVDAAGNVGGTSVTVFRDTTPPTVTVVSPANGAVVADSPVSVTFDVYDEFPSTLFFGGLVVSLPPGANQVTIEETLVEGTNFKNWQVSDQANNASKGTLAITLDLTAPIVTIDSPLDGAVLASSLPVPVSAVVDDLTETTVTSDPAGLLIDVPAGGGVATGAVPLVEGQNAILVTATDGAGRMGTDSIVVTVDTVAPIAVVDSPAPDAFVRGVVEFDGRAADPLPTSGLAVAELRVDGVAVASFVDPAFSFGVTFDTTLLADGPHTLSVYAEDRAGNTTLSSISVTVDNTAPTIAIANPSDGDVLGGVAYLDATVSDVTAGVSGVRTLFAGGAPNLLDGSVALAGTEPVVLAMSQDDTTQRLDGPLAIKVLGLDAAGNEAARLIEVQVDNTAPTKSLVSPVQGQVVCGVIDIVADAQDPNLTSLEIVVNGVSLGVSATSPFSVPFDTGAVLDGSIVVTSIATDSVGNVSTCSVSVTVDNQDVGISPRTLNLRSRGGDRSVTALVEACNLELLLPVEDHAFFLHVPGGSRVPATLGFAGDDVVGDANGNGVPDLLVKFDRQGLINAVRAGTTAGLIAPQAMVDVTLTAEGRVLGLDRMRIRGN